MTMEISLKSSKISLFLAVLFAFVVAQVEAQKDVSLQRLVEKYPGEYEVVVEDRMHYQIKLKKGKLDIIQKNYSEQMILNLNGIGSIKEVFYSSQLTPVIDFNAYTIKKDNTKEKTNLVNVSGSNDGSIFYDDIQKTEITFTNLEPGARKVLETTAQFTDPALLHRYVFQSHLSSVNRKFTAEVDDGVEVGFEVFNNENGAITFNKTKKGNKTLYTWSAADVASYAYEDNQPDVLYDAPHIALFVKSYVAAGKEVHVLGKVNDLFNYYNKFVDDLNQTIDSDLKQITDELIKNVDTEEERVRRIFYWVKDNIKYIAYENGYEGFIPREASFVCERKFGDCKDMASIITAMCKHAKIDGVKLAWIGTRDLPYTYDELPTPASDNHMIAAYLQGEQITYLDATDQYSAFGYCSTFIQGKEALIRLGPDKFIVRKVPIIEGAKNTIQTFVHATIDGSKLVGNGQMNFSGLARAITLARMNRSNDQSLFNQIKSRTRLGNNKYFLDEHKEFNQDERDSLYRIAFDFHLDNYLVLFDENIYVNMFLKEMAQVELIDDDRTQPIQYEILVNNQTTINLDIANAYDVQELPPLFTVDNELIFFSSEYHVTEGQLSLVYQLEVKKIQIENSDFELWNETATKILANMKETITLSSKK